MSFWKTTSTLPEKKRIWFVQQSWTRFPQTAQQLFFSGQCPFSHLLDKTLTLNESNLLSFLNLARQSVLRGKPITTGQRGTNINSKLQISSLRRTPKVLFTSYALMSRSTDKPAYCENSAWVSQKQCQRLEMHLFLSLQCHLGPLPFAQKGTDTSLFQLAKQITEEVYFQPQFFPCFLPSVFMFPHSHSPHLIITTLSFCLNTIPL